eukprot:scaffold4587_cov182-Amphora_coffeaeformis.AAC.4
MNGIQELLCDDLFLLLENSQSGCCSTANTKVMVSFFEFYGGHAQDLLNERQRLRLYEDGKNEIVVVGLREVEATNAEGLKALLEQGHQGRTTHQTESNDTSSRSHAICQICLKQRSRSNKLLGKISLVDLAGSERGSDTRSHNFQRRSESADINTSLLSLKECIRALDKNNQTGKSGHVPYRGSKLTLLLKDCFTSSKALTTMIATVSPGASSADHSLNTLRYADRIKEKRTRKSPQRSMSASAATLSSGRRMATSVSPRRPVDSTNRRASSIYVKPSAYSKSTSVQHPKPSTASSTRITRSTTARAGLQHSNSIQTASSADSRLSYRSAPVGGIGRAPSRSFSGTSSADEELDSLLNDDFDPNLSQDSSFADYNSTGRSDTLFEPPPVGRIRTGRDGSPLKFPDGPGDIDDENVLNESSSSLTAMMESLQQKHLA